ncbi:folate-binding protein [Nakamurella antarctica]|uniref:Folate-binding protein n=1 Tax=Nakamurella antarctica TaxID=1902245 RepID=A0A3G8ZP68_9ACTN|nr:folate-binding protein YgfZ [Nakamurella antarctica]AZI59050.1 folate-binding protein [Nakamurella antarctica]
MTTHTSALLTLPGAVAASGVDGGVAWHYGDPTVEQRRAEQGVGLVDRDQRGVITVIGADRHDWLNKLTSQLLLPLADGTTTQALVLTPQGHVEYHFGVTEVGDTTYLDTDAGTDEGLSKYLQMMKFWSDVEVTVRSNDFQQLSLIGPRASEVGARLGLGQVEAGCAVPLPEGGFLRATDTGLDFVVPHDRALTLAQQLIAGGATPVGTWADDALRIPTRRVRTGVDTDDRTIPHEVGLLGVAVHMNKGCYRGQETVARVANLGRPPRRLVMLNLDGTQDVLPNPGDDILTDQGRVVGRVGTVAIHYEDGPIALALVKRNIGPETPLLAGGVDARIDPADVAPENAAPASAIDRATFTKIRPR